MKTLKILLLVISFSTVLFAAPTIGGGAAPADDKEKTETTEPTDGTDSTGPRQPDTPPSIGDY